MIYRVLWQVLAVQSINFSINSFELALNEHMFLEELFFKGFLIGKAETKDNLFRLCFSSSDFFEKIYYIVGY